VSGTPVAPASTRVLYVDYSLGFGGAIKSLALTLRELPSVSKLVLTSQDAQLVRTWLPDLPVRSFRRLVNYRTKERLAARVRPAALRWMLLKAIAVADLVVSYVHCVRLLWLLRCRSVDLVHLNNGFTPSEALLAARIAGVPCIVHLRDYQHDPRTLRRGNTRGVAHVIAVSDAVGRSLDGTPILPSAITTVYDPVDIGLADSAATARDRVRRECGLPRGAIAVGIFGRVIPWKGQLEFVRAVGAAMRSDPAIHAVIVGDQSDGARAYVDVVRRAIRESGVEERFVLAGYRENVEEYYAAMDVVVHASITPEPFGMVVTEAMAAGRPVIAADAGGPREVVEHGVDGLLVPPRDVEMMRQAILTLAGDPAARARMGAAGRRKTLRRFGTHESAARVAEVYAGVLARRAGRGT
jgi:glycosyltransferase involved in cell wall biosynthesis